MRRENVKDNVANQTNGVKLFVFIAVDNTFVLQRM